MKNYPALDLRHSNHDLIYSALDDFSPTAIEERPDGLRAYFPTPMQREAARQALKSQFLAAAVDVSDEDWARRSQEGLQPVSIGGITVVPGPQFSAESRQVIVIAPSMGFGTGHHATTRLCLAVLQTLDIRGRTVVDVGTGSGILAIAAARLGAARAVGIDNDPDAIRSACENLELNPEARDVVRFVCSDVSTSALPEADVLTANLTGTLLVRMAAALRSAVGVGGTLILAGLLYGERDAVVNAFDSHVIWEQQDGEWVGLAVKKA